MFFLITFCCSMRAQPFKFPIQKGGVEGRSVQNLIGLFVSRIVGLRDNNMKLIIGLVISGSYFWRAFC